VQALSNVVVFALKRKMARALIMYMNEIGTHHELHKDLGLCRGIIIAGLEGVSVHDGA
jgi:hypothetical protein